MAQNVLSLEGFFSRVRKKAKLFMSRCLEIERVFAGATDLISISGAKLNNARFYFLGNVTNGRRLT